MPPRFSQLALSIETLLNISELSLEDVTGQLKAAEDRLEYSKPTHEQGKLLSGELLALLLVLGYVLGPKGSRRSTKT